MDLGAVGPMHIQLWGSQLRGSLLPTLFCWGSLLRCAPLHHLCPLSTLLPWCTL